MANNYQLNRNICPPNHPNGKLTLNTPEHHLMENGLNIYYIEEGLEEVCRVDVVIGAGSVSQSKKLCASFTNTLLKEGTRQLSSKQIAEKLDFHGAFLSNSMSKDKSVLTLFSIGKYLGELLPMVKEIVTEAIFVESEFMVHLDRSRQEYLINTQKPRYIANIEFNQLMFGKNSKYGQHLELDDFNHLNTDDLKNFHRNFYQPKNSYIIVSGRPTKENKRLINNLFGKQWENNNFEVPVDIIASADQIKGETTIKKDKFLQSAIKVGKRCINKFDEDYSTLLITNTILGGYFGSRLMSNLREDKGMTYGIGSYVSNFLHASYFAIRTEVNINQTAAALFEIKKELSIMQSELISQEELKLVKNYIYGNFLKNFDGPFAMAEMFRAVTDFGLDFNFYTENLQKIMDTKSEDILKVAQNNFRIEDMTILVVGDN